MSNWLLKSKEVKIEAYVQKNLYDCNQLIYLWLSKLSHLFVFKVNLSKELRTMFKNIYFFKCNKFLYILKERQGIVRLLSKSRQIKYAKALSFELKKNLLAIGDAHCIRLTQ